MAVAVIRGLGECGNSEDAEIVERHFQSPFLRVRAAAILALGCRAPERYENQFIEALADPAPSISCTACIVLRSSGSAVGKERLISLLSPQYAFFIRRNALRLVFRLAKWERISVFLMACRDPLESISVQAVRAVRGWLERYNRSLTVPSKLQVRAAVEELRGSQEFLDRSTRVELEVLFKDVGD